MKVKYFYIYIHVFITTLHREQTLTQEKHRNKKTTFAKEYDNLLKFYKRTIK